MTMNPSVSHNAVSRSHSIGASKYVIVALVIIIGLFAMFFLRQPTFAQEDSVIVYESVQIHEGDSLWTIAEQYAAGEQDIRSYIQDICSLNNLSADDTIYAGEYLILPIARSMH